VVAGPAFLFRVREEGIRAAGPSSDRALDPSAEQQCLRAALVEAVGELRTLAERVAREIGEAEAGIFTAQALMLEDPTIAERADHLIIAEGLSAAAALAQAGEEQAGLLAALPDPLWQARAADVRDAVRRALAHLQPGEHRRPSLGELIARAADPIVLVAEDLTPSDTVQLPADRILGIALAGGSATAHAAILARALGIAAVAGLGQALFGEVLPGEMIVLDGAQGTLLLRPSPAAVAQAREAMRGRGTELGAARTRTARWRGQAGRTQDGQVIEVLANVGSAAEAQAAADAGAEGIGLLRTEFLFAGRDTLPDEDEQAELYATIIASLGATSGPVTIRTLDAGADKPLPALAPFTRELPPEPNPALGIRGIRLQLLHEELLAAQLRAIVLAAARTRAQVRVMLPMIAEVGELRRSRTLLRAARAALAARGVALERPIPLGVMIETPAAVFSIETLAREAAFLSIGTNDLTQYVMAADRLNPALTALCQPLQPAVLRAIATIAREAERQGRHAGVCGEMAGDPPLALLLVGLGIRELSMAPASIAHVKAALAGHSLSELTAVAERALFAETAAEVQQVLADSLPVAL
jgi:phosphoenolpyruvate-protein phosphotransferase